MGLDFLNKKSWHPASFQNIEKVWVAQQEEKEKVRQYQEHQKKLKEERQIEDLKKAQVEAGIIPRSHLERMDWMYTHANSKANTKEDFFASMTKEPEQPQDHRKKIVPVIKDSTVNEEYEAFVRFHEDPLVAIMKEQQQAKAAVLNNPLKVKEIQEEIERLKEGKKKKKHHKKHHHKKDKARSRKHSKEEEKERRRKRHDSRSRSRSKSREKSHRHEYKKESRDHHRGERRRHDSHSRSRSRDDIKALGPPKDMMAKYDEIQQMEALRKKQNIDYRGLTEEEKAKKVEEMRQAAMQHKAEILQQHKSERKDSHEEEKEQVNPKFIRNMRADVYTKGDISVEEKIKRNAHYNQPLRHIKDQDE